MKLLSITLNALLAGFIVLSGTEILNQTNNLQKIVEPLTELTAATLE